MKRLRNWIVFLVALLGMAGCAGKGETSTPKHSWELVSEDMGQGNDRIMKTDKGYYYCDGWEAVFRYYDIATGKEMYLCNKPECKHDGNKFCIASIGAGEKYKLGKVGLYSDRIWVTALEETDTQYLLKLLTIALDGSEMDEFVTYLSVEKTGQLSMNMGIGRLAIHRNKAMIPISVYEYSDLEQSGYFGTAVVDLETKKVTYLDEEPLGKENPQTEGISAYGDSFYYYRKEGKKNILHRYYVEDGTEESLSLLSRFQGLYVNLDEDTIVYIRKQNIVCVYHLSTGESEEIMKLTRMVDGEYEAEWNAGKLMTDDGTNIYVVENQGRCVHVYDREFTKLAEVNFTEAFSPEEAKQMEWMLAYFGQQICFLEDYVYLEYYTLEENKKTYFSCKREDFLKGTPSFQYVYGAKLQ